MRTCAITHCSQAPHCLYTAQKVSCNLSGRDSSAHQRHHLVLLVSCSCVGTKLIHDHELKELKQQLFCPLGLAWLFTSQVERERICRVRNSIAALSHAFVTITPESIMAVYCKSAEHGLHVQDMTKTAVMLNLVNG